MTSASPFLYRLVETDSQRYEHRLLQMMTLCVGIAYAFCIALTLFAGPALTTLFGTDFSDAAAPLRVHVWSNVFAILGVAQRSWILSRGLLWISLQNTILGAVVNLGLNIIVIPTYGAVGASWTTLASMIAATIIAMAIRQTTRPLASIEMQALSLLAILGKPRRFHQDDSPSRSATAQQAPCERP
jgi:O-antigen/teichoic acid export membrane protein